MLVVYMFNDRASYTCTSRARSRGWSQDKGGKWDRLNFNVAGALRNPESSTGGCVGGSARDSVPQHEKLLSYEDEHYYGEGQDKRDLVFYL